MGRITILEAAVVAIMVTQASAVTTFYSFDRSFSPNPLKLVSFNSDPASSDVDIIAEVPGLNTLVGARMDLSADGRLFASLRDNTVHEIDRFTGNILGSVTLPEPGMNLGLAAHNSGILYVYIEHPYIIYRVDFDTNESQVLLSGCSLDNFDFDADGNLIATDLNQSGEIYNIPLDGSWPSLIATVPQVPHANSMTFSRDDNAFYFATNELEGDEYPGGRHLWELSWSNGLPVGVPQYVKQIGNGSYVGLAAIPEPSTALLLSATGLLVVTRRHRAC